jgi:hypothetical protein
LVVACIMVRSSLVRHGVQGLKKAHVKLET